MPLWLCKITDLEGKQFDKYWPPVIFRMWLDFNGSYGLFVLMENSSGISYLAGVCRFCDACLQREVFDS